MNKKYGFICLVLSIFLLSGCKDQVEIEDRDFVQTLMITKAQENYHLYYALPDLTASTGQNTTEVEKKMREYQAASIVKIEEKYNLNSEKRMDYSHLKAIILDESFSTDKVKMNDLLSYIQNNYEISRNTPVFITYEKMSDLAEINGKLNGGLGSSLENIVKNTKGRNGKTNITIGDCITAYTAKNQSLLIPVISMKQDTILLDGAAIFYESTIRQKLSEYEYRMVLTANGFSAHNTFFLDQETAFYLEEIVSSIHFNKIEKKPTITISISGILDKKEGSELSEQELNHWLQNELLTVLSKCYMQELDVLNLYRLSGLRNKNIWLHYKNDHSAFLNDLNLTIITDFKVRK